MVCLNPIFADLIKCIVQGIRHRVFLPVYRLLLQSCIGFCHRNGCRCCLHPFPCFQIHLQIWCSQLKALEILDIFHFLCCRYDTGTSVCAAQQLKTAFLTDGLLDFLADIAVPCFHEVIIIAEQIRGCVNIRHRGKGCQCTY